MNRNLCILLPVLILASSCLLQDTHAIEYVVTNTVPNSPGGQVFNQELGVDFTLELMRDIHKFIIKVFRQRSLSARRPVKVINVYITEFPGYAHTKDNNINISASALDNMYRPRENSRWMFTSLMFQEMAHVFQWNGESTAPQGLVEGIADYVMVKSGFCVKRRYTMPGAGQRWDEGFGVTERFLENCDVLLPGFT